MHYDKNMTSFIIFCKSYRNDVLRAKRLCESVALFNKSQIPFYLSVPAADIQVFNSVINFFNLNQLNKGHFFLIKDEDIVLSNPESTLYRYQKMSGYLSQQVIKAEAWRFLKCRDYLCIDSDSYFHKEFYLKDFIHEDGLPYTLLHQNDDFFTSAKNLGHYNVIESFNKTCNLFKKEFGRTGPNWDFGPSPLIWSANIWAQLSEVHLKNKRETIWDAIERLPYEIFWYGEALLKFSQLTVHPTKPKFFVHHYEWQPKNEFITGQYLGIVSQSNWDKSLNPIFAKKKFFSRLWKSIKKFIRSSKQNTG
jgi:hypothetical protein